jgi:hypothetical protein
MADAVAGLSHQALAYRGGAECLPPVLSFVRGGLAAGEAVSVGVGEPVARLLREALPAPEPRVAITDITELGRNPGRIIAAMTDYARRNPQRPVRFVSEPFWTARSAAEIVEATRHEALLNRAFAGAPVTTLCLYDADALDPSSGTRATSPIRSSAAAAPPGWAATGSGWCTRSATWWSCGLARPAPSCGCACSARPARPARRASPGRSPGLAAGPRQPDGGLQHGRVHERLRQVPAHLALVHVVFLGVDAGRPAG